MFEVNVTDKTLYPAKFLYAVVDLETTGLDPRVDGILEAALLIADPSFDVLARSREFVRCGYSRRYEDWAPAVQKMHADSGLLTEYSRAVPVDASVLGEQWNVLVRQVRDCCALGVLTPVYLTGRGVGRFDRQFMAAHMRLALDPLHYRDVDVATLSEANKLFGWTIPVFQSTTEYTKHRAADDVEYALEELRHYGGRICAALHRPTPVDYDRLIEEAALDEALRHGGGDE